MTRAFPNIAVPRPAAGSVHPPSSPGSPWHIANLLRASFPVAPARVEDIRDATRGNMPDGHLSDGTILRAIGTLAYCRLVRKVKGADGGYRYQLLQLDDEEWRSCEFILRRLGDRPSVVLKDSVRSEMLTTLPRLTEQDVMFLREEAVSVRKGLYAVPLPALSFFHSALLAKRLMDRGLRVDIAQVHGFVHYYVRCGGQVIDPFPEGYQTRALNLGTDLSIYIADSVLVMPLTSNRSGIYTDDSIQLRDEALAWAVMEIRKEEKFISRDMPSPDPALPQTFAPLLDYLGGLFAPLCGGRRPRLVSVAGDFDDMDTALIRALDPIPEQELIILNLIVGYRDGQDYRIIVDDAGHMRERLRQIRSGDFDAEREEYEFQFDFTVFARQRTIQLSNLSIGKPADSEHYRHLRGQKVCSAFFSTWAKALQARYQGWQVTCLAIEMLKDQPFRIIPHLMGKHFSAERPANPYRIDFIGEVNRAFIVDPKYAGTLYVGRVPSSAGPDDPG